MSAEPVLSHIASGFGIDLADPDPALCRADVIAAALAKIPRFGGHTSAFYSVAQHSVQVAELVRAATRDPLAARAALLHDAHEAFLGDWTVPVQEALCALSPAFRLALGSLRERVQGAIHDAHGLPRRLPAAIAEAIDAADRVALATEKRDLLRGGHWWQAAARPAPGRLRPLAWINAADAFLAALERTGFAVVRRDAL